uniref:Sjogren syndrome/scleroderma autoantigen 1 n=1 Tax=Strigops habroptila TaxID=2489341 RepID=A0A672UU83_STRHB
MGQLLLRGYRMLGRCCPHCGTILLQDKDQKLYCVSCQDLDCDGVGNGALRTGLRGLGLGMGLGMGLGGSHPSLPPAAPEPAHCEGAATGLRGAPPGPPEAAALAAARAAVLDKLGWAARELPRTASAEGSAQLCALVRACAEALGGLQALAPPGSPP